MSVAACNLDAEFHAPPVAPLTENELVARVLDEVADLLATQEAKPYRSQAFHRGADTVRSLGMPVADVIESRGSEGLARLPHIGAGLARAIAEFLSTGRLRRLEWLRGHVDTEALLTTIPGVGPALAHRFHEDLGVHSLEELENAAYDGRLAHLAGLGPRRVQSIKDSLAQRLRRPRLHGLHATAALPIAELLDVDREYRSRAAAGSLHCVTPRRFNPQHRAWLPILHTERGDRRYTALFSNTARAHTLNKTHDWVIIYAEDEGADRQATVVTEPRGPLEGLRVVRGRERESLRYYRTDAAAAAETARARKAAEAMRTQLEPLFRAQADRKSGMSDDDERTADPHAQRFYQ